MSCDASSDSICGAVLGCDGSVLFSGCDKCFSACCECCVECKDGSVGSCGSGRCVEGHSGDLECCVGGGNTLSGLFGCGCDAVSKGCVAGEGCGCEGPAVCCCCGPLSQHSLEEEEKLGRKEK